MSVFSDTADAIVALLQESGRLGGIEILADRQRDLQGELRKVVNKSTGNLILVTWTASERSDANAGGPRFVGTYSVTVWAKPLIGKDEQPADEIVQLVTQLLDDHRPVLPGGQPCHIHSSWRVLGAVPIEHPDLLVHRIPVQIPLQIPKL